MRSGVRSLGEASSMIWKTRRNARWRQCICCAVLLLASNAQADQSASSSFDFLIEPQQVVKLASSMVGVVAELRVDRGDVVSKGQILGKLEDGVEEANLALAKARARNEYAIKS